jgi:hypothetical protein
MADTANPASSIDEVIFKTYQQQLQNLKAQQGALAIQSKSQDKKKAAAAKQQLDHLNARMSTLTTKTATLQNKVYAQKGQYENLLTGDNRDAYLALKTLFGNYGLESLAKNIYDYAKNGYSSDTISLLLQDTPEYKQRFSANDARKKAGLPVLSPAEYLSTEQSYRQIMHASGLPTGYYDTNEDFTNFISKDLSPTELQSRVDLATQATALASTNYKKALNQMGIGDSELTAYFLDPDRALPYVQKAAATAAIGAEALQRGLNFDQTTAEELATRGITRDTAATGYSQIGAEYGTLAGLGNIYGGGWSQKQAEEDVFTGGTAATAQRKKLIGSELAAFSGNSGAAKSGLSSAGGAR